MYSSAFSSLYHYLPVIIVLTTDTFVLRPQRDFRFFWVSRVFFAIFSTRSWEFSAQFSFQCFLFILYYLSLPYHPESEVLSVFYFSQIHLWVSTMSNDVGLALIKIKHYGADGMCYLWEVAILLSWQICFLLHICYFLSVYSNFTLRVQKSTTPVNFLPWSQNNIFYIVLSKLYYHCT